MGSILIIEDDEDLRTCYELLLTSRGHLITLAANGLEGLQLLAAPSTPDFILLDLQMPIMDGWEFLDRLRAAPALRKIPVCVVTACTVAHVDGATEVLQKPFSPPSLLRIIDCHLTAASHSPMPASA